MTPMRHRKAHSAIIAHAKLRPYASGRPEASQPPTAPTSPAIRNQTRSVFDMINPLYSPKFTTIKKTTREQWVDVVLLRSSRRGVRGRIYAEAQVRDVRRQLGALPPLYSKLPADNRKEVTGRRTNRQFDYIIPLMRRAHTHEHGAFVFALLGSGYAYRNSNSLYGVLEYPKS